MLFETYKQAFLSRNNDIWWGGETHYRSWDDSTMYLYFFVVLVTFIISYKCNISLQALSKNSSVAIGSKKPIRWYYILIFLLLCILGLRGSWVGMDTIVYSQTFESATSISEIFNDGSTAEPLYKLFQFLLRSVFSSRYVAIFIFSSLIIYFVFNAVNKYFSELCITIAVPAFVCLYYFQSFNLIRITLAASFMLSSFHLLVEEQYKKYAIRILITSMMHYSTMVMFFPLGLLILYKKNKGLAYAGAFFSVIAITLLTKYLGDYIALINRYSNYISENDALGSIGLALFIDYLPCLFVSFYILKKRIQGQWADMMICFTIAGFIIRLSAYFISATGRLHFHFMSLTILLLPYWLNYFRQNDRERYLIYYFVCIAWLLIRLHIYFIGYLSADGIMPYNFFWND